MTLFPNSAVGIYKSLVQLFRRQEFKKIENLAQIVQCSINAVVERCEHFNLSNMQAFSATELSTAKERVRDLQAIQNCLDDTWKGRRWIMDVLTYARDKQVKGGVPLGVLYAPPPSPEDSPVTDHRMVSTSNTLTPVEDTGIFPTP